MAEVVGLVVGVVALAGTFKDCIDLFAYISASKTIGRDYELLNTKLQVEKTLLLQWAARVRLLSPPALRDPRLDDADVARAVSQVLAGIQLLLSDSQGLQSRYGLRADGVVAASPDTGGPPPTTINTHLLARRSGRAHELAGPRMMRFLDDFHDLAIRTRPAPDGVPVLARVRWAVHDKERFDGLVGQLAYFVARLNALVPDTAGLLPAMARDDLGGLSVPAMRLVVEAAAGREPVMAGEAEGEIEKSCTRRILQRLWYRVMDDRRSSLSKAHARTLRWALESPISTAKRWDDLSQWLENGSDIYWISGKAGSGKSTLMKHIYEHEQTKELLSQWTGDAPLTMADFFFYALGTHEQKSHDGLARALLYQMLKVEPSLIRVLFPNLWAEAEMSMEEAELSLPTQGEMKQAFETVSHGLGVNRRFCFFIDGLDEYSGNYLEGIAFLKSLVANPDIKVLVSSRPIPTCVQAFSCKPRLQLQDLTQEDILGYINDTIGGHSYMEQLTETEPDEATGIVDELVHKASGVFLWVVLACRSLMEGFAAFDNCAELRKRVDELPPELEDLFQHMIGKIEPRYQSQAARLLRVCHQSHLDEQDSLHSIGLGIVDSVDMDAKRVALPQKMSNVVMHAKCEALEGRLRSRCCGLLEIRRRNAGFCFCNLTQGHDDLIDSTVTFIHRTVFDFLNQPGVWDLPCLQTQDPLFDPEAILAWIYLQLFGLADLPTQDTLAPSPQVPFYLRQTLAHAARADASPSGVTKAVMFGLEMILQFLLETSPSALPFMDEMWIQSNDLLDTMITNFPFALLLAVEAGMVNFVRMQANRYTLPQHLKPYVLFIHAISRPYVQTLPLWPLSASADMVRCLLSSGSDPNTPFLDSLKNTTTPWKFWLEKLPVRDLYLGWMDDANITKAFIDGGADVDVSLDERTDVDARVRWHFIDSPDGADLASEEQWRIREAGLEILQMVEDRRSSRPARPASGQGHLDPSQEEASERQPGQKRASPAASEERGKRARLVDMD